MTARGERAASKGEIKMRIALGSDHRGAQIAQKIAADVLLREHYAGLAAARRYGEQLVGAHLISGASCSDSFDESERVETNEDIAIYSLERTAPGRVEIRKPDFEREDAEAAAKAVDYPDVAAESLSGRWGTAAEVASVVRFLTSDAAAYVNGQNVPVNGGFSFRRRLESSV